jgi:hypothetical protein
VRSLYIMHPTVCLVLMAIEFGCPRSFGPGVQVDIQIIIIVTRPDFQEVFLYVMCTLGQDYGTFWVASF